MKATKEKLRQIIQEELRDLVNEGYTQWDRNAERGPVKPVAADNIYNNPHLKTVREKLKQIWSMNKKVTDEDAKGVSDSMLEADPNIDPGVLQKAIDFVMRDFKPLPVIKPAYMGDFPAGSGK